MDNLDIYTTFGLTLSEEKNSHVTADCPFCGKAGHLYIRASQPKTPKPNASIGSWQCKVCALSGNQYTFLDLFHRHHLALTRELHYRALARYRKGKVPTTAYQEAELAYCAPLKRWLIPVRNPSGSMTNLKTYGPFPIDRNGKAPANDGSIKLYNAPGCKQHLFNSPALTRDHEAIIFCEGEWDALALRYLLGTIPASRKPPHWAVVGVPGAGSLPDAELAYVQGATCYLIYDHDEAGSTGMDRAAKLLYTAGAKTVLRHQWPDSYRPGYDLFDAITDNAQRAINFIADLDSRCVEVPRTSDSNVKVFDFNTPIELPSPRTKFSTVLDDFRKHGVKLTPKIKDALAITLSVVLSGRTVGDPLWLYIVGSSGSGKSLILESTLTCDDFVKFRSTITHKSLISGYKTPDGEDPSLVAQLGGKCLVVKDYTNIIALPHYEIEQLYAFLRDAYDGQVCRSWGNNVHREYNGYFSIVAGVTHEIHKLNHSALGERFLKFELSKGIVRELDTIRAAIFASARSTEDAQNRRYRQASVQSFLAHCASLPEKTGIPENWESKIVALTNWVSYCRSQVSRDRYTQDTIYDPSLEAGTRSGKQLVKLAQSLAVVLDLPFNTELYRYTSQVAWDTCSSRRRNILAYLCQRGSAVLTDLTTAFGVKDSTTRAVLADLRDLGLIKRYLTKSAKGAPTKYCWKPTPEVLATWKAAAFPTATVEDILPEAEHAEL